MTAGFPSLLKYDSPVKINDKDEVSQNLSHSDTDRAALDALLPPRRLEEDNELWIQRVSSTPATRHDVLSLKKQLDQQLQQRKAREVGICPIREELYKQCFEEVIRQVAVNCTERGLLLLNIRNEMSMTIKAYQAFCLLCSPLLKPSVAMKTLFESAIAFGLRKTLCSDEIQAEREVRLEELEQENASLKQQVAEWKAKCTTIEKREVERREQESIKHKEELEYTENYAQQLRQQLDSLTIPQ